MYLCILCTYFEIMSTREVWRAQKRCKCGSSNSSPLSAFQTSQVLNISTYALLKHELIVYNIIQVINAAINFKFYYCRASSKPYASLFSWLFFFLTVKLLFLSWNWEKVYSKKIVKSTLRCRKTINSTKNYLPVDTTTTLNYFHRYRLTNSKVFS